MVRKITDGIFSSIYFWVSVFILLCFFMAAWYVNNSVKKEAVTQVGVMTTNIALSNIQIIVNMLDDYDNKLSLIKVVLENNDKKETLQEIVEEIRTLDPSISNITLEPLNVPQEYSTGVWREIYNKDNQLFFKFSLAVNRTERLCLLVNLLDFHKRISEAPIRNSAYITIINKGIYLYHPDEKKIGSVIREQDMEYEKYLLSNPKDTIINTKSDYLDLPVYSYYKLHNSDNEQWLFTAHLPNLGISDSIQKTANDFLVISLLAIFSFLVVFGLGIYRWQKEAVRRRQIEQENMNLLLKSEQHKQTMISTELERLKSGLNPHFLFNSLGSLRVLISKDAEVAKYFAITLSNLYRYMLKQENQNIVTLAEELEFTENYINLQKIRFANKIVTEITLSEEILTYRILPISLQLLVENCIKHTKISDNEPLYIRIYAEGEFIVVTNNYNPREQDDDYSGKGIDNLIKRYSILTKTKCTFKIQDGYYFAKIPLLS
ncbi:sensor histidine kinase [Dysgonomonas gadei]|uniref:sensor histidine kinase n=1 Tax=Dysgonomonas gadei TaxID=156974 RepID=UPI003AF1015B